MVYSGQEASVPTAQAADGPPQWQTGTPPEGVLLLGHSGLESRADKAPELYIWTGKTFQSLIGWYDGGITHWIATEHRTDQRQSEPPSPPEETSGNRRRLSEKMARRSNVSAPSVGMTRSGMNPESPAPTPPRSPQ